MNRTDRLYALVEELRARAPRLIRAAELAARFEVSGRTIERDLLALQQCGVPIWTQPGPGGGYGLHPDATLPPLNLTAAESTVLATAVAATSAMPFPEAGRSALRKLAGAMAAAPRETASRLASQIRVVPGPSFPDTPVSQALQRALLAGVAVELSYRDGEGRESGRVVEPAGILGTRNGWYLVAWCRERQAPRTFRLDRIAAVTFTAEPITSRPLDAMLADLPFDLAQPALIQPRVAPAIPDIRLSPPGETMAVSSSHAGPRSRQGDDGHVRQPHVRLRT
ncbi:MAG TPA: YafY family protein [Dehalococcoidia bacterium]|nr:YafY family protein [Dehalococcoidia bacterium]